MILTDAQVTAIRTSGLTDNHWAREFRTTPGTIRRARTGVTYTHLQIPPDTAPRMGTGCGQKPLAKPAREFRGYFNG